MKVKKCLICGKTDKYIDVRPRGICIGCMSKYHPPEHIPTNQERKYYETLLRKYYEKR